MGGCGVGDGMILDYKISEDEIFFYRLEELGKDDSDLRVLQFGSFLDVFARGQEFKEPFDLGFGFGVYGHRI